MRSVAAVVVAALGAGVPRSAPAQVVNWRTLGPDQRHVAGTYAGVDYGIVLGAAYAYHYKAALLGTEWTLPAGGSAADDFRGTVGVSVRWLERGALAVATDVRGIVRRYDSPYVRLLNAGADLSGTVGLYGHRWFLAGRGGFDQAVATRIRNGDALRASYPAIRDGWYGASGGNFHLGLEAGRSMGRADLYLALGRVVEQDFRTTPTVPFYARLGLTMKTGRPAGRR